jgi:aromatic-L-amino-acid/L-tryptophan decarboxylase
MDRNGNKPDGCSIPPRPPSTWRKLPASGPTEAEPKLAASATSLDPNDWDAFRDFCAAELHGLIDHLAAADERPAWQPVPSEVKHALAEPLPIEPQGARQVCDDIRESILPYTLGNTHPRFFGWVHGTGTAGGMLAELYAAAMNANLGGREHAPVYVERTVIEWCKQMFGFPTTASGLLLSGTSMANLVALAVARQHHFPTDVRRDGVASAPKPLVAYASAETHCSVAKAIEFLGLGGRNLRRIPVNRDLQIDLAALERAVADDRAGGYQPFCVVGSAGTVNTAAIDDLDALAAFCEREKLWYHVDGAFGGLAILSDDCRAKLKGIERADSLAFDFHKWLHVPYDAGCVLVRDGEAHRRAFSTQANYLSDGRGAAAGAPWFCEFGPELSRGFRALKVWFTIKEHGLRRLGEKIGDNCRQARFLGELVDGHPRLERLAPVSLNIVCFRYVAAAASGGAEAGSFRHVQPGLSAAELDRFNSELVIAVQESGVAVPSTTRIDGKLAIRVNITNHRTRTADLQLLVNAIDELAPQVAAAFAPARPRRVSKSDLLAAKVIETVCSRTELQPLLTGVTVTHDPQLSLPFVADAAGVVRLGSDAVGDEATCVKSLRHALELVALQRLAGDASPLTAATVALFAYRTANAAFAGCAENPSDLEVLDPAVADGLTPADWETITTRLRESAAVAGPTEFLLTTGGDTRLEIDPETGLSGYGCRPQPVPGLASFGSCTATTITRQNFAVAEATRQRLLAAALRGELHGEFLRETESLKRQILEFCGAMSPFAPRKDALTENESTAESTPFRGAKGDFVGTEVLLCSSGTDAEIHAVGLTSASSRGKLTNIVIAPGETGTGVPDAAAGRHFSTRTPLGVAVAKGELLAGIRDDAIDVVTIAARDAEGNLQTLEQIDRDVEQAVETAVRDGECLLHVLDASKTGWGAPGLPLVRRLVARHGERLTVVVDACQMRIDRNALGGYLGEGFLVQITGSKTFGGPPFSGALIVPPRLAERFSRLETLPAGLLDYAAQAEWPASWKITRQLRLHCNAGLLLRWNAALREMRSFYEVPETARTEILRDLRDVVLAAMNDTPGIDPLPSPVPDRGEDSAADGWDGVQTIFPFRVRHRDEWLGGAPLTHEQMKSLHRRLIADLSAVPALQTSERDRSLAAFKCHIGQPVELCKTPGSRRSALRFCTGANVVSRVFFDATLGSDVDERLDRERQRIRRVFDKIGLVLDHWNEIEQFEAGANSAESNRDEAVSLQQSAFSEELIADG